MTTSQSLTLYNIALKYFKNENDATTFIKEVENAVDNKFDNAKSSLATKEDLTNVRLEIKESKAEMIKWMFIFWASSIIATIGGLVAIIKFMILK